jgi:hypothetical protein
MGDRSTHSDNSGDRELKSIWQEIAEQLRQDKQDPGKMVKLWRELDRAEPESKRIRIDIKIEPSGQIRSRSSRVA